MLEQSLKKGAKAAQIALPKGNTAAVYRPAEIAFPIVERRQTTLKQASLPADSVQGTAIDAAVLSDALLLESLRHARYLEL